MNRRSTKSQPESPGGGSSSCSSHHSRLVPSSPPTEQSSSPSAKRQKRAATSAFSNVTNAFQQLKRYKTVTPSAQKKKKQERLPRLQPQVIDIYQNLVDQHEQRTACNYCTTTTSQEVDMMSDAYMRHYGRDYFKSLKDWEDVFFHSTGRSDQHQEHPPIDGDEDHSDAASSDTEQFSSGAEEDESDEQLLTPTERVGYNHGSTAPGSNYSSEEAPAEAPVHGLDDVSIFSNGSKESQILEHQPQLTDKMRAVLVDWMVELSVEYNLGQATLHLAVVLLNRSLECETDVLEIDRDSFQCLGCVCVWMASKIEETCAPSVEDFSYISADSYSIEQICDLEVSTCAALKFRLWHVTPLHYVEEFLLAACPSRRNNLVFRHMVMYLLELSLLPYELVNVPPRKVTAAAVYLALINLGIRDAGDKIWTPTLEHYTGSNVADLVRIATTIHKYHKVAEESKLNHAFAKYSKKKYHCVSLKTVPLESDLGF